jgi:hypothetical protein
MRGHFISCSLLFKLILGFSEKLTVYLFRSDEIYKGARVDSMNGIY